VPADAGLLGSELLPVLSRSLQYSAVPFHSATDRSMAWTSGCPFPPPCRCCRLWGEFCMAVGPGWEEVLWCTMTTVWVLGTGRRAVCWGSSWRDAAGLGLPSLCAAKDTAAPLPRLAASPRLGCRELLGCRGGATCAKEAGKFSSCPLAAWGCSCPFGCLRPMAAAAHQASRTLRSRAFAWWAAAMPCKMRRSCSSRAPCFQARSAADRRKRGTPGLSTKSTIRGAYLGGQHHLSIKCRVRHAHIHCHPGEHCVCAGDAQHVP
jgi:hypothetical protein